MLEIHKAKILEYQNKSYLRVHFYHGRVYWYNRVGLSYVKIVEEDARELERIYQCKKCEES